MPAPDLQLSSVELETADGPARAYLATPSTPATGAVVIIPEAFGLNDHIESVARRFARDGFVAVGLDMFHRSGIGVIPYDDGSRILEFSAGLDDPAFLMDFDAASAHLATLGFPASQQSIVGFCVGGRFAFLAALRRQLGAAISYYGGGIVQQGFFKALPPLLDEVASLKTPWLGLFGDLDKSIPIDDVELLRTSLGDAKVRSEIVRYAEANHGFNCDARPSFNEEASNAAFDRSTTWLHEHLG